MEEKIHSGSHSGGVVKNRSSSGCLIIKKKPDGMVGGSPAPRKLHELKKKKKRPRLTGSDSVSSEEELLELYRRRGVSGVNQVSSPPLVYKRGVGNHGEYSSKMNDFGDMVFSRNEMVRETGHGRSKLDVYDFDEYDDLSDVERIGARYFFDRDVGGSESRFLSPSLGMKSGSWLEFESGSSKGDIIYKRRNSFNGSTIGEKIRGGDRSSSKRRFEVKNDSISTGKDKFGGSNEAIRLQGKNGVLKVMVKHKKENTAAAQLKPEKYVRVEGNNVVPRSGEVGSKNLLIHPCPYSERKLQKTPLDVGRIDKDQRKRKSVSVKSSEESDAESEDSGTSTKLQSDSVEVQRSIKRGRSGGNVQTPERMQPTKLKEGKVKRGSGTEKQLLREKIRNMLVNAGWTIDYRPRRGRDYFDAVYVNPSGTAYWSIIKAYDALQKQLEEEGNNLKSGDDRSFAPISGDILSKLTRQTRKKIEKELKRKKREEGGGKRKKETIHRNFEEDDSDTESSGSGKHDEKLSSFIKRSGKSLRGASKEGSSRDGSNASSKLQERGEKYSFMPNSRSIHGRKSKKIGRCTLLIRSSEKGLDSDSDGFATYTGKRNLLSWLIDSGTVKLSEKVHYMNRRRTRIMLEGWITRDGIHCGCCSKILTISKFEIHAASKLRQPFQNIYLSSGISLLQCQVDAWNKQEISQRNGFHEIDVAGDDPNDDTCAICGDGGNLICCDSCPSTFHQNCLDIRMLPAGDWHCPHCSCKFCGLADVSLNNTRKHAVLTCSLCEGKYHASCMEEIVDSDVNSNTATSFCGKNCRELFECLQKLLGVKHELEAGLCWSLIHRTDLDTDTSSLKYPQRVEWNSKLAVALTVMDECFLPIIDRRSGINMIHNVLYNCGSNFTRLNYSGFYTALLERGDEIVSAASIRIRGNQFAEMPFIGTRHIYRRQGMCRRLFHAVEWALRSLKVEKLIIPAISELMDTWTRVFGFSTLGDEDKLEMKTLNMLAFPGTDMLQKKLLDLDCATRELTGVDSLGVRHSSVVPDIPNKCDLNGLSGPSSAAAVQYDVMMNEKFAKDLYSQDAMTCAKEKSLQNASGDIIIDVKRSDVSNEVKPLVSSEAMQENISSSLHLDTSLRNTTGNFSNECSDASNELKLLISSEETQQAIGSSLHLDTSPNNATKDVSHEPKPWDVPNEDQPPFASKRMQETPSSLLQLDTYPENTTGDIRNDAKHSDVLDEVKPLGVTNKGMQENISSSLQLDTSPQYTAGDMCDETKFSDVSAEVKPLVASDGMQGTISSSLQLDTKLRESKVHISPDSSPNIHEIGEPLDDSSAKHHVEASMDSKLSQEVGDFYAGTGLPPADVPKSGSSDAVPNGFFKKDDLVLPGETQCSKSGPAVHYSLCEASLDVMVGKPSSASPAQNSFQDAMFIEVDDIHAVTARVSDVISSSRPVEHLTTPADGTCTSPQDANEGAVGPEASQPDSCGGDSSEQISEHALHHAQGTDGISSIQLSSSCEISAQFLRAVEVKEPQHSCVAVISQDIVEGDIRHAHDINVEVSPVHPASNVSCGASAENVGAIDIGKLQLDSCDGDSRPFLDNEVTCVHVIDEVAHLQPESDFSNEIFVKNDNTVELKKTHLDSCGDSIGVSGSQPITKLGKGSQRSENPATPSDSGTGESVLPASNRDDQGAILCDN